jgi:O-antigen/teichoic acid export membrane protein
VPELARIEPATGPVEAIAPAPVQPPSIDSRHLMRSLFGFGVAQALSWIAGAALLVMMPRFLGDVSLGKLGFAMSLTGICGLFSDVGVTLFLIREVARAPAAAGGLLVNAFALSLGLNSIAALGVVGVAFVAGYDRLTREVVVVLAVGMVVSGVLRTVQAVLQGLHRMRILAVCGVVVSYANAVGIISVLAAGGGVAPVAVVIVVSNALGLAVSATAVVRRIAARSRPRRRVCAMLLAGGLPFLVGQAALAVYGQIDMVLLSFFTRDAVIGWYAAALRLMSVAQFLPSMLAIVVYPMLSANAVRSERFNAVTRQALRLLLLVNLPIATGIALLPDRAIHLLGYPASFDHSVVPLVLLTVGTPMIALDMVLATVLSAADRQRRWAMMGLAAAALNVILNLAAIPLTQHVQHNGAIGAAAVTTLTELFLLLTAVRMLPDGVIDGSTLLGGLRCLAAAAAMVAVVLPLRSAPLALPVLAGAVTFGCAAICLGAVSMGEVRLVLDLLRRRGRWAVGARG